MTHVSRRTLTKERLGPSPLSRWQQQPLLSRHRRPVTCRTQASAVARTTTPTPTTICLVASTSSPSTAWVPTATSSASRCRTATRPRGGAPEGTNGAGYWASGPVTLTNPVFTLTVKINEFSTASGVTVKDGSKSTLINVGESRTYSDTSRPGAVKANTLTPTPMSAGTVVITRSGAFAGSERTRRHRVDPARMKP